MCRRKWKERIRLFLALTSVIILTVLPAAAVQAKSTVLQTIPLQEAAFATSDSVKQDGVKAPVPQGSEAFSFPEIRLPDLGFPEPDLSSFDKDKEKEKLREAIETLDKMGLSPEKVLERIWDAVRRPENRRKAGEAVEDIRDRARELIGKDKKDSDSGFGKITKKVSEEVDKAADQAAEKVTEKVKEEVGRAAEEAADQVLEEVSQAAEGAAEAVKK